MSDAPIRLRFDEFELDEGNALLTRSGSPVALPPKAFALLCALARHGGRLASKDALLDAVWGHRHVSESVLKTTIAQVRSALADDAGQPRYIETVARRGYRFIARIDEAPAATARATSVARTAAPSSERAATLPDTPAEPMPAIIGRTAALGRLRANFARANGGQRQLVWVAGEAGIGKTTLIDRFAAEVGAAHCAYGQCVEQFGSGEPYLPVLEALKTLSRRAPKLVPLMRQVAPTWLIQMPWLIPDTDRAALHTELSGAGQDRMVRELWELMERYTQEEPLLLVTEDLHWSDQGTLRLMDHFARRRGSLRLMWLASYRLTQVIAEEHPLQQLRQELQLHRLCDELLLDPFSEAEVAEYVEQRVPGEAVAESFVKTLHAHTEGLPLFVASVLETLVAQDARVGSAGARALPVPDSLSGAIEKQLAKLPTQTRAALEAASVCGMEFRAATVAALLEVTPSAAVDPGLIVEICDDVVRRKYWLREAGIVDLPDGSVDMKYAFRHAVYRHVFYQRLAAAQRISYHRRAARALEQGAAAGLVVPFAELASHYERGREYRRAIECYSAAAEGAIGQYAPQDALELTDRALELLPSIAAVQERHELEMPLAATRGIAFGVTASVASSESVAAYARVRELYDLLPQTPARALLLGGIGWSMYTRSRFDEALATAQQIHGVSATFDDPLLFVFGCNLMGVTFVTMGRFKQSADWLERGLAASASLGSRLKSPHFIIDPEVSMRSNLALPYVQLGLFDRSRVEVTMACARANAIGQPIARMLAAWCGCLVNSRLDDVDEVAKHSAELDKLVGKNYVQQALGPASWYRGWLKIRHGDLAEGLALVREGYAYYEKLDMFGGCSEILGYAVEALILDERWDDARATLDEANALVDRFGERLYVPELLLLRARIEQGTGDDAAARRSIEASVREARAAEALGAELKATLALAARHDRTPGDLTSLRSTYARITEGLDTRPVAAARALLAAARSNPPL